MEQVFKSRIFILPGMGSSGPGHWQSLWENKFGFTRINQADWESPDCGDWIRTIKSYIDLHDPADVILVGHSLACATIAYWAKEYNIPIKGALLVAPSDTEADSYPAGTTGFTPVRLLQLPFRSITVASSNDLYVTIERARLFADSWGSKLIDIGEVGHINAASGIGEWAPGLEYLSLLDR